MTVRRRLRSVSKRTAVAGGLTVFLILSGCATFEENVRPAREAYFSGRYGEAVQLLEEYARCEGKDQPAYRLELVLPLIAQGKLKEAEEVLRKVRDRFEDYEKKLATEWIASILTDDTAIAYPGEDYEKILIRVLLALVNLLRGGGDALAYAHQVVQKQVEIIERSPEIAGRKLKANYKNIGIGRYLIGLLREAEYDYTTALRYYKEVKALEPGFKPIEEDLKRAEEGLHSQKGHGVLYVFALLDRGPYKVEVVHEPSTQAVNLMWAMATIIGRRFVTPSIVPVKVPELRFPERTIQNVKLVVDDSPDGATWEIMNVHEVARKQFAEIRDYIVAKALLRRLIKQAIVEAAKRAAQRGRKKRSNARAALEIGALVAAAAWEAVERADTRCWSTLPASIQVLRLELPVGEHVIELRPQWGGNPVGAPVRARVQIEDDMNTYCLAIFPTSRAKGVVLVSNQPPEVETQPQAYRYLPLEVPGGGGGEAGFASLGCGFTWGFSCLFPSEAGAF